MAVPYITGEFRPGVARMNALIEALDGKLTTILYGKSPILAFNVGHQGMPGDLLGKCFFFVDPGKPSKWAYRCPGAKIISGAVTRDFSGNYESTARLYPYDHQVFLNAENAATGHAYDLNSLIVSVTDFGAGAYGSGLTKTFNVGLFDHSLRAHRRGGVTSFKAKTFFYKETTDVAHAERYCDRGLAELVLEGVTEVNIPDTWDKYLCFRIHNLNYAPATVRFGSGAAPDGKTVTVSALGCAVVRRDRTVQTNTFLEPCTFSNYRVGPLNYFFQYEAGDFRHFWFFPTSYVAGNNVISQEQGVPWNSMAANNLANPSLIYDWVRAFRYNYNDWVLNGRGYAWFHVDEHEVCDERARYCGPGAGGTAPSLLGDPNNGGTNLGDLVFHKGKVMLVKFHKTRKLFGSQLPDVEWEEIEFNGFGTLVADWAPYGIEVVTIANNQIEIRKSASVTDWDYMLVPFGTNLLRGANESYVGGRMLPVQIDPHWFDQQTEAVTMNQRAPQLVIRRTIQQTANTRQWVRYAPSVPGQVEGVNVAGDPKNVLVDVPPPANTFTLMWAPQTKTVAELLGLNFFGDKNFATQDTAYTVYTGARVVLTPHGHVLLFYEEMPASLFQIPENDLGTRAGASRFGGGWELSGDRFRRKRSILLRGNGFGYPHEGRISAMFHSPRYGSRLVGRSEYLNPVQGVSGVDYRVQSAQSRETDVKVLRRVKRASLANGTRSGRFWQHALRDSLEAFRGMTAGGISDPAKVLVSSNRTQMLSANGLTSGLMTYQLLPEHYNGLAQIVNQCTTGKQLDYRALRFEATYLDEEFGSPTNGQMVTAAIGITPPQESFDDPNVWTGRFDSASGFDRNYPVPADAFDYVMATPNFKAKKRFAAYQQAGIPIKTTADIPGWNDALNAKNIDRKIEVELKADVTNAAFSAGENTNVSANVHFRFEYTVTYQDSARAAGTAFFYNLNGFDSLSRVYSGFKYVSIDDVDAWLSQFGLPFGVDELFAPMELKLVQSSRSETPGRLHKLDQDMGLREFSTSQTDISRVNGTKDSFGGDLNEGDEVMQRDIDVLAFAPVVNGTLPDFLWKAPPINRRTIQNQKFWNSANPCFFLCHGTGYLSGGGQEVEGFINHGAFGGGVPGAWTDPAGPYVHLEFGDLESDAHVLWMQMNWRLVAPLAYRAGSNTFTAAPNLILIHQDFWMGQVDGFASEDARLFDGSVNNGFPNIAFGFGKFFEGGANFFYSVRPDGAVGGNARPWVWVTNGTRVAPEIQSGVNLLPMERTGDYGVQFYCNFVGAFSVVEL